MKSKKIILSLIAYILILVGLVSCNNTNVTEDFVFGTTQFGTLDPAIDYNGWYSSRFGICETLFVLDDNLEVQPLLAQKHTLSEDNLTWDITLKQGVTFQNGKILDAQAVKDSLDRLIKTNTRASTELDILSITANENIVSITTNKPNPTFINSLCDPYAGIIDATLDVDNNRYPIGTGPYIVEYYKDDVSVNLLAYENYWAGVPSEKSIIVKHIVDLDTLSMAMQNGEIDVAYGLSYDTLDVFENNQNFDILKSETTRVYMLHFNSENEFMKDENFRRAITMAIDKNSYAKILINGAGTPTKLAFPSYLSYGDSTIFTDVADYDTIGAKTLLEENGYKDTNNDGIIDKDGKNVSLKLITYGRSGLPQSLQALQSSLKELGIETVFEKYEAVEDIAEAGDFDICAYSTITTPTGDPYSYLNSIASTSGNQNYSRYSNPKVDELLDQLAVEIDTKKRSDIAIEIQKIITSDSSFSFMFHLNMFMVKKDNVSGIRQSPVDYYWITHNINRSANE